ncbi:MAG: hypothetical protein PHE24_05275 [Patescibacteria group bacterium]|nr:hypothetical protein [Patescibacteria group bacterium]
MKKGLAAKYKGIDKSGKEAVLAGKIKPYAFPVSLQNRFSVFAVIELNDFFQMFLARVQKIETMFGLKLILAGRDVWPHFTVLEGNVDESRERLDYACLIRNFLSGTALASPEKRMLFRRISINQLLLDNGNLLLVTAGSPFLRIREKLSAFYQSINLIPCPRDITHSTISRIAEIPDGFGLKGWKQYHDYVSGLQRLIRRNDLVLRIRGVHSGEAYEFLTAKVG